MEILLEDEVLDQIRKECEAAKGQKHWAKAHNVSEQYLSDVLRGKCDIGPLILESMRLTSSTRLFAFGKGKITKEMIKAKARQIVDEEKAAAKDKAKRNKAATRLRYN